MFVTLILLNPSSDESKRTTQANIKLVLVPLIRFICMSQLLEIPRTFMNLDLSPEFEFLQDVKSIKKKINHGRLNLNTREYVVESKSVRKQSYIWSIVRNTNARGYIIKRSLPSLCTLIHEELRCFSFGEKLEIIAGLIDIMYDINLLFILNMK